MASLVPLNYSLKFLGTDNVIASYVKPNQNLEDSFSKGDTWLNAFPPLADIYLGEPLLKYSQTVLIKKFIAYIDLNKIEYTFFRSFDSSSR